MLAPQTTLIIPTYNRPQELASCLESLTRLQEPAGGFEIIVVDDGSDQPLDEAIRPFEERLPLRLLPYHHDSPASQQQKTQTRLRSHHHPSYSRHPVGDYYYY